MLTVAFQNPESCKTLTTLQPFLNVFRIFRNGPGIRENENASANKILNSGSAETSAMHATHEDRFQLSSLIVCQDADIIRFPLQGIKSWCATARFLDALAPKDFTCSIWHYYKVDYFT